MIGYRRRQSYKRKLKLNDGRKVDIFFSSGIFELYKQKLMFEKGVRGEHLNIFEFDKKLKESKNRIRDGVIKENIEYLIEIINENCPENLNGKGIENAVSEFRKYLFEEAKINYDINLVVEGNL